MKFPSTLRIAAAVAAALSLTACGGGDGGSGDNGGLSSADPVAAVDDAARTAFQAERLEGMGLAIYDSHGTKVFEHMYGNFSPDQRVAIASASKLVSGVTLFRLIDQGYLSLDSTTGQVLGWTGDEGAITLRELMSFTSGLQPENHCTYQSDITLADCVGTISRAGLAAAPSTRFDYGSTHLAVAGRMAEVVTGKSWNEIFAAQLRDPLGLASDIAYYANPLKATGTDNALLAGGLRLSMNEYGHILRFVFDKGVWNGTPLLAPTLFDTQTVTPYPDAIMGTTPAVNGIRYGLTAWLECSTPATGCSTISSPGVFGFTPWLDRTNGYYAILGMEDRDNRRTHFGADLEQQLKPLIVEALSHE